MAVLHLGVIQKQGVVLCRSKLVVVLGGASFEPLGNRSGSNKSQSGHGGVGTGFFAEADVNAGVIGASVEGKVGRNFFTTEKSSELYYGIEPKAKAVGEIWGLKAGASAGMEFTIFDGQTNK